MAGVRGTGPWMGVALRQSKRFAASDPVTRYWLANCVGFHLAGGGRGTVERILADDDPHDPSVLEVRTSRHRVRRVPTSAVIAVVPQDQLLVVALCRIGGARWGCVSAGRPASCGAASSSASGSPWRSWPS
jgi:hypothetical protein